MVSLNVFRTLSLYGFTLTLLMASGQSYAQYNPTAGVASTEYTPLRTPSVRYGGYQNNQQYLGVYGAPQAPAYVASRVCQPYEADSTLGIADAPSAPYQPGCESGYTTEYTSGAYPGYGSGAGCYTQRPRATWYASAAGLYMDRSKPSRVWTTYENNNNSNQLMNTQDADPDWESGVDLRIGRFFACDRWVMELGYWSLNNFEAYSDQMHANGLSSPLQFNDLEFAVGDPVVDYFDSAADHRISRSNELHNVELSIIEGRPSNANCSPWSHRMLAGLRYFRFDESLIFSTLNQGGAWGGNGGIDEVNLSNRIKNSMVGVQIGCLFERQVGCKTRFFITPKFGVFGNHIENRFDLRRGDGTAAMPSSFSGVTGSYPVESSTDVVSFLAEANIGLQYQISCCWTVFGGYRVVALTNVGLADEQIPQFIVDIPEIADIDTNGSLVLHGGFFGVSRKF